MTAERTSSRFFPNAKTRRRSKREIYLRNRAETHARLEEELAAENAGRLGELPPSHGYAGNDNDKRARKEERSRDFMRGHS